MIILHVLSNFEHPDWNLQQARATVDFEAIVDRCIERFQSIEALEGSKGNNLFTRSAKRLTQIKMHLELMKDQGQARIPTASDPEIVPWYNQFPEYLPFDDDWLRAIMEPWDYQFTGMENQSTVVEGHAISNSDPVLGILLRSP